MASHAPGPWKALNVSTDDEDDFIVQDADRNTLVMWIPVAANAHLIATAPEMKTVIVRMLDALWGDSECTHGMEDEKDICDGCAFQREKAVGLVASEMRAVIAKAEGKDQ